MLTTKIKYTDILSKLLPQRAVKLKHTFLNLLQRIILNQINVYFVDSL